MSTDKFDNVPRIVLDKEDRDSFQRTRAAKTTKSASAPPTQEAPTPKSSSGLLMFVLLIALGGYGASYYLYQEHQKTAQMLSNAADRIYELERKLSATGEELDQSAVALRVQVNDLKDRTDVLWQEMDKLWASAWRRNQAEISDLKTQLTRESKAAKDTLADLQSDVSDSNNNLVVIQGQVNQQLARAEEISGAIESVVQQRASSERQVQEMGDQVATVAMRIEALVERINELETLKEQIATLKSQANRRITPPAAASSSPVPPSAAAPSTPITSSGSTASGAPPGN